MINMEKELIRLGFEKIVYNSETRYELIINELVITIYESGRWDSADVFINDENEYEGYATGLFFYDFEKVKKLIELLK